MNLNTKMEVFFVEISVGDRVEENLKYCASAWMSG